MVKMAKRLPTYPFDTPTLISNRKGLSYFGKVNGILVNDADNTLISKVEVSGANRAGVTFTSTAALMREAGYKLSYKTVLPTAPSTTIRFTAFR